MVLIESQAVIVQQQIFVHHQRFCIYAFCILPRMERRFHSLLEILSGFIDNWEFVLLQLVTVAIPNLFSFTKSIRQDAHFRGLVLR